MNSGGTHSMIAARWRKLSWPNALEKSTPHACGIALLAIRECTRTPNLEKTPPSNEERPSLIFCEFDSQQLPRLRLDDLPRTGASLAFAHTPYAPKTRRETRGSLDLDAAWRKQALAAISPQDNPWRESGSCSRKRPSAANNPCDQLLSDSSRSPPDLPQS